MEIDQLRSCSVLDATENEIGTVGKLTG